MTTRVSMKHIKLFSFLFILFFGLVYFTAGFYVNWDNLDTIFMRPRLIVLFAGLALVLAVYFIVCTHRIKRGVFVISLLTIGFLVRLIWITMVPTEPESDFRVLYQAAIAASEGDFSFKELDYFQKWVYQLGFVLYEATVIKVFNDHFFILKFLNVIFGVLTVWLIYRTATHLFNESVGRLSGLLYALYVPAIVMTSILTNQILSTLLFYSGAYLLVKHFEKKRFIWIAIGILFAFGHIIRPVGTLVLIAAGLFVLVVYLIGKSKKDILIYSSRLIGIIISYAIVIMIVNQSMMATGFSDYPLENRDPGWKFVLGLNHETTGRYSTKDFELLSRYPIEKRQNKEIELIKERLADPNNVALLFKEKFKYMWGHKDEAVDWIYKFKDNESIQLRLEQIEKIMFISFFLFGIIVMIELIRIARHNPNSHILKSLFFILLIIGYAMIHLVIEIQTRYRFFIIPSLIIIQSYGVYVIHKLYQERRRPQ